MAKPMTEKPQGDYVALLDSQEFLKFCQSHSVASDIDVAAGADTAKNRFLQILVRNPGEANYVSAGHESADQRWFEIRICAYDKVSSPSVVATRCCKTCSHWLEEEFDSGECKQIRRGLDITVKAGWDGGYVEKVETEADFECSLWDKIILLDEQQTNAVRSRIG